MQNIMVESLPWSKTFLWSKQGVEKNTLSSKNCLALYGVVFVPFFTLLVLKERKRICDNIYYHHYYTNRLHIARVLSLSPNVISEVNSWIIVVLARSTRWTINPSKVRDKTEVWRKCNAVGHSSKEGVQGGQWTNAFLCIDWKQRNFEWMNEALRRSHKLYAAAIAHFMTVLC